ncbi:MAG: recombination regulator RecX [Muribaculaceae bacterium]|nr:recombination regulator RecX [Muribaculaceae bacterium]
MIDKRKNSDKKNTGGVTPWDEKRALEMLASACAKGEQCEYDLRLKMKRHNVDAEAATRVIDYLTEHNFLNELRFARAYACDKVRFNGWGKQKVALMLRAKHIPQYAVNEAIESIDESLYYDILCRLVRSAMRSLQPEVYEDRLKLMRKLYARGFESDKIQAAIADVTAEQGEESFNTQS